MYAADSTTMVTLLDRTPRPISWVMRCQPQVGQQYSFTNALSVAASAWTTNRSYAKRLAADAEV